MFKRKTDDPSVGLVLSKERLAQVLFYSQSGLEEGEERMEIDFLAARPFRDAALKPRICPIEVKSPRQYGTTSLDRFKGRFGKRVGDEYVLHPKPLAVNGNRMFVPLYMSHLI